MQYPTDKQLRKMLQDTPFVPCSKATRKFTKGVLPVSYYQDLKRLCSVYGASFDVQKRKNSCYQIEKRRVILMHRGYPISTWLICTEFCHELAHHLQHTAMNFSRTPKFQSFEDLLMWERQAERIGYHVYKKHFTHLHTAHWNNFTSYRTSMDVVFLRSYYTKYHMKESVK